MKYNAQLPAPEDKLIVVEHKGQELSFLTGAWGAIQRTEQVYNDINAYWASLPMSRQDAIWQDYVEIHEMVNTINHFSRMHEQLRRKVADLMSHHPFDEIKYYVERSSKVKYPKDLKDAYGVGAPEGSLTYLRGEYIELISLIIQLRPMIPVWGEYIDKCKSELGTHHKDYQAGLLLAQSAVPASAPFKRLHEYITAYLGDITSPQLILAANMAGISTANLPDSLLNTIIVKRLSVTDLVTTSMPDEATNVMSKIYNHSRAASEKSNNYHRGVLRDKTASNVDMGNDEDNTSRIELIKVRESISEGDMVAIEHYCEQTLVLARKIDSTIPKELVSACMNHLSSDGGYQAEDFRFWLTSWVLCGHRLLKAKDGTLTRGRVLSPKCIEVARYEAQLSMLAAAQALLWHWGFHELAVLISDKPEKLDTSTMIGATTNKLNKTLAKELAVLYPMPQVLRGKRGDRVNSWPNPNKEALEAQALKECIAIKDIDTFVRTVGPLAWAKAAPAALVAVCNHQVKANYTMLVSDIKNQLATLVLTSRVPELHERHIAEPHWYRNI